MKICMIGTGYVGLVNGACLADIGNQVICADIDKQKIEQLNNGNIPIYEPGLKELITKNKKEGRISFSHDIRKAVHHSTIVFIAVGTPPDENGSADLSHVFQAAEDIAVSLNKYKIIVDKSTVPVGTAAKVRDIILEKRKEEVPFSVVSNPEFLKEGSAIRDIFEGDRIVIGAEDDEAIAIMKELYKPLNVPIQIMSTVSAEMVKYASNAFLATKISFINEIANICEKVGANVNEVARGMGTDKRISSSFLKAGVGYGGSCFPKDIKAITATAGQYGYKFKILDAVMKVNQQQRKLLAQKVLRCVAGIKKPVVGILGLAFKPNTDDVRESPALHIIQRLRKKGIQVKAYDPIAIEKAREAIPDIEYCNDVYDTCHGTDVLVVITDWNEFLEMDLEKIYKSMRIPLLIDGRNMFDPNKVRSKGFKYISMGRY